VISICMGLSSLLNFLLVISPPACEGLAQQSTVEIYLPFKVEKKRDQCPNILYSRTKTTQVCVTSKPVISVTEFAYITEIINDNEKNYCYFNLIFTSSGYDKIKMISQTLPETEMVLTVNETVVGFIKNMDQISNRAIRIDGVANAEEVHWVHSRLKEIIPVKN
jgi:hypothetical protein